jgi:dTDP-4-amino-4,6-dideoxygalactose transaminase
VERTINQLKQYRRVATRYEKRAVNSAPERHAPLPLPRTEALTRRVIALPTGTAVGVADIELVCEIIRGRGDWGCLPTSSTPLGLVGVPL